MPKYTVKPGDCIASIAATFASTLQAVWDHPDNKELRELRQDPFVLHEGDEVHVPLAQDKQVTVTPGERHVFVLHDTRCDFEVTLRLNDSPRAQVDWVLKVAGETIEGRTGDDGTVRASIPAAAKTAVLRLPESDDSYDIALGDLDPLDTVRGVQSRLRNLGYYRHGQDGDAGPWTARALRAFQIDEQLPITGEADEATLQRLRSAYGR